MSAGSSVFVVSGNSNRALAEEVATELGVPLCTCQVAESKSGEVSIRIVEDVAGGDVYIVQPTCASPDMDVNTSVLELLFLIRRMKLAGARRITAVVPSFAYARQDRKTDLRVPLSAAAVCKMIEKMGVDRVVTLDLHSGQIQGCFCDRAPMDNLSLSLELSHHIASYPWFDAAKCVVVSPDAGGVTRAREIADLLRVGGVVTIVKRRAQAGVVESMQTVGDVTGMSCIIVDDMVDTGGTLVKACQLLKQMGAIRVIACCTHGIMTDPACERINACDAMETLVVSNSIPQAHNVARCPKLTVLPVQRLIADAIKCYQSSRSLSSLFADKQ